MTGHLAMVKVLSLHAGQITRYGSSVGVRDLGLLEAALYTPQTEYYAGLIEEAAARWERLAPSHPFIDGNKRLGFAVTCISHDQWCAPYCGYGNNVHLHPDLYHAGTFTFAHLALGCAPMLHWMKRWSPQRVQQVRYKLNDYHSSLDRSLATGSSEFL